MALTKIDDRGLTTPIDLLDNEKIRFGTGNDLELYHDGSNSWIDNGTGLLRLSTDGSEIELTGTNGSEYLGRFINNGAVELYHDSSKKFETQANGVTVTGGVYSDGLICGDDDKVELGTDGDLKIYHSGSHGYIDCATGNLLLRDTGAGSFIIRTNDFNVQNADGTETIIWGDDDAAVKLYYDGSPKLETTSDGTQTTGRSRIYYGGNAGKPTLLIGADNAQGSTSLTNATQKACRVGMPHYTNAEEPTNMFHGVSGDGIAEIRYGGGTSYMNAATSHRFYTAANTTTTGGTEHMRIESDGDLRLSSDDVDTKYGWIDGWAGGNMVFDADKSLNGTSGSDIILRTRGGEKVRVQHDGGISFNGDTSADNALDDYEEGTFTPSISSTCRTGTITYTNQVGFYTKIGNRVFAQVYMRASGGTNNANQFVVDGLPYSCVGTTSHEGGGYHTYMQGFFSTEADRQNIPWVTLNTNYVKFHKISDGDTIKGNDTSTSSNYLIFHVQYVAA